jgi:hypothetical protein
MPDTTIGIPDWLCETETILEELNERCIRRWNEALTRTGHVEENGGTSARRTRASSCSGCDDIYRAGSVMHTFISTAP